MSTHVIKQANLFYRGGSSDKVYQVVLSQTDGGYLVTGFNGRRGSTLTARPQTKAPVSLPEAEKVFASLVQKKKSDRDTPYSEGPSDEVASYEPPAQTSNRSNESLACQLLTDLDDPQRAAEMITKPDIAVQMKYDGKRIMLDVSESSATAYNRSGQSCSIAKAVTSSAVSLSRALGMRYMLDGEMVGEDYYAFDLLEFGSDDIRPLGFKERFNALCSMLTKLGPIHLGHTRFSEAGKVLLTQSIFNANLEGIVLKGVNSPYLPGRRPDQYKHKFTTSGSFVVTKMNNRNSVALGAYDGAKLVDIGNCTIRSRLFSPKPGDVLEIKYLHAFPESNHIYQPRMIASRDDLRPEDCHVSQLKFKGELKSWLDVAASLVEE